MFRLWVMHFSSDKPHLQAWHTDYCSSLTKMDSQYWWLWWKNSFIVEICSIWLHLSIVTFMEVNRRDHFPSTLNVHGYHKWEASFSLLDRKHGSSPGLFWFSWCCCSYISLLGSDSYSEVTWRCSPLVSPY